jgi:cellulose 1,4-beta-cellobiosidase
MKSFVLASLGAVSAQHAGTLADNYMMPMDFEINGQKQKVELTMDSNWRWAHKVGESTNCYTDNQWDSSICGSDGTSKSCAEKCAVGAVPKEQWKGTYGVTSHKGGVDLGFVTEGPYSKNVGSRMYVLNGDHYRQFHVLGKEISFEVNLADMPCGTNGALYFVEMPADGGLSEDSGLNKAGPKYGTGYCDAQCPRDLKWEHGRANTKDWKPNSNDPYRNSGTGNLGACCAEIDLWESNRHSMAFTMHPSSKEGVHFCHGDEECGTPTGDRFRAVSDRNGCDVNPNRFNHTDFYGRGSEFKIDTTKPFTVVTQFHDEDEELSVTQHYIQNGKKIEHPDYLGKKHGHAESDDFCSAKAKHMNDRDSFKEKGGMKNVRGALKRGVTLVISMWDDIDVHMNWLDSVMEGDDVSKPGNFRGPCKAEYGEPERLRKTHPDSHVSYYNFKYGNIGHTDAALLSSEVVV